MSLEARALLLAAQAIATAMAPGAVLHAGASLEAGRPSAESYTQARAEDQQLIKFMAEWL